MSIANNKKAFHDYFIEDEIEAGLVLDGWEVKAIRAGRVQLKESYIHWKKGAFYLVGCHITALPTASTHVKPDPVRQRKLLLKQSEINKLIGKVERSGYTLVPLNMHYKRGYIKMDIGLAKGKKQHDKRQSMKEADWKREKQRLMKNSRQTAGTTKRPSEKPFPGFQTAFKLPPVMHGGHNAQTHTPNRFPQHAPHVRPPAKPPNRFREKKHPLSPAGRFP